VCLGQQLKDHDCAIAALSKVLALQPCDPRALVSTDIAYAAKGIWTVPFASSNKPRRASAAT
jgi:hypothetical protein